MSKATHNGTCQACGRSQAVTTGGTLAKHGYTVDYGYFNGTCSGSDHVPLELETSHNEDVVAAIRNWADERDMLANGNIETVNVAIKDENDSRTWATKTVQMNREEFVAASRSDWQADDQAKWDSHNNDKFDEKVESVRFQLRRNAASARKDADILEQLRDKTFGNELASRELPADAPKPQRESFSADANGRAHAQAYDRQRQLKEQGIRSRVTGDARYATITYKK